jgi:hypothetical protein
MGVWRKKSVWPVLLLFGALTIAIVLVGTAEYLQSLQPFRATLPFFPKPPLLTEENNFSCLASDSQLKQKKRFVTLHGPDWQIQSVINPKCLPERELIFSTEEGRQFLPRPLTRRVTFWITRKDGLMDVKIWGGSGSRQLDDIAMELATNHRCKNRSSKNCKVQVTWRNLSMGID